MKHTLILLVVMLVPTTTIAQQWTQEQLGVIEDLEDCWDAWNAADAQQDYSLWKGPCLASEHALWYWAAPDGGLQNSRDWDRGITNALFDEDADYEWVSLRPLSITVDGDIALVYYSPMILRKSQSGTITYLAQWRFAVLKKVAGTWKYFGEMAAPASGE